MKTHSLFSVVTACGLLTSLSTLAQNAGGSSAGSSSGGAGTTAATAPGSGGSTAGTAGGSNIGVNNTSGAPNMSPTQPSGSSIDQVNNPAAAGAPTGRPLTLPPGITPAPAQPGVSPLTGLRTSEIPATSPGTAPIGPQPDGAIHPATGAVSTGGAAGTSPGVNDPAQIAAHPQTNTVIGPAMTTVVPTPPPAPVTEVSIRAPLTNGNDVWVAGHYTWQNGQWTWVDGSWQRPPAPGATWAPGFYDEQNRRWTEGHWETTGAANTRTNPDANSANNRGR